MERRRALGLAAGVTVGAAALGGALLWRFGGPDDQETAAALIPDAPLGDERLEQRESAARGQAVDFYTAVPAGHGDGRGLPVCLVLHGASATAASFPGFGFGRFLSDAVRRGVPPFVLAGATGGRLRWEPSGGDDPQRMAYQEVPAWCAERGFDTTRIALWGWSMGGYGVLRLAQEQPGRFRAVAAFSPAVSRGDRVFAGAAGLAGTPVALWCGEQDDFYADVKALGTVIPGANTSYADGGHTRTYWNSITPAAFDLLGHALAEPRF